ITEDAPPVVEDDVESTHADSVSGTVVGSDPDGDALTFSVSTGPSEGQVTMDADGAFTYTPDAGATGSDTFTYAASDGRGGTATATTTVHVLPTGSAEAVDDYYQLSDDGTLTVGAGEGVRINDVIPGGDSVVPETPLDPGIASLYLDPNGAFSITITADANASATPITFAYDLVNP